jgi:hypothetical protein
VWAGILSRGISDEGEVLVNEVLRQTLGSTGDEGTAVWNELRTADDELHNLHSSAYYNDQITEDETSGT